MAQSDRFSSTIKAVRRAIVWLVGGALSVQLFWTDLTHSSAGNLEGKAFWGRDFVNLWAGGRLLRDGGSELIYHVEAYRAFLAGLFGPLRPHNYSYPPVTFPIAELFSFLPYAAALTLWLAATGALFVWAARPWWPKGFGPAWLALLTPAALINIWAGHYGFLIGALFLLGWRHLGERPLLAGVFFGLMLVKPHLALLVPLVLLLRREWPALLSGAATVAALIVVTAAAYGWEPWRQFLFGASVTQAGLIDAGGSFYGYMSTSAVTALLRIGAGWPMAVAAQLLLGAAALAALVTAVRRQVPTADIAMLTATATFLVLPYAFNYDLTVVTIAALRLWADEEARRAERWLAIGGFLSPQLGLLVAPLGWPATPLLLAGLFAAQVSVALRRSQGRSGRAGQAAAAEAR